MQTIYLDDDFFYNIEQDAISNNDIYFVCGDGLDKRFLSRIMKEAPERVISAGISEQNQVSIATGLALQGKTVYCLMMNAFLVHRALDQLKMACYSNANVKFLGLHVDIFPTEGGYSHVCADYIPILRNTPNLKIYTPCTKQEVKHIMRQSLINKGPEFISLCAMGVNKKLDDDICDFNMILNGSKNCCILSYNNSIGYLFSGEHSVIAKLAELGICPTIISVCSIEPFNDKIFKKIVNEYSSIITFEAVGEGALASSASRVIASTGEKIKFLPIYIKDENYAIVGNYKEALNKYLRIETLAQRIYKFINPVNNAIFSKKVKIYSNGETKTKHNLLGLTYYKEKSSGLRMKKYILGFIHIGAPKRKWVNGNCCVK